MNAGAFSCSLNAGAFSCSLNAGAFSCNRRLNIPTNITIIECSFEVLI